MILILFEISKKNREFEIIFHFFIDSKYLIVSINMSLIKKLSPKASKTITFAKKLFFMKLLRTLLFIAFSFFILTGFGQIPAGYYNAAAGLTGAPLKTALYNIIKGHTVRSYPLWTWYDNTDLQTNGKIWDIYSDNCDFVFSTDQCGSYSNVCDCYNNEHSFPKSWFGDVSPMNSDIFHIYPTDGKVNGMRNNYPYGETSSGTTWGNGKLGNCTYPGYTNTVFEPADQYKGDIARTYFYMVTRYENVVASWENLDSNGDAMLNGTSFTCFEPWALSMLLEWNDQYPVSQKEINRNNAIYNTVQFNRNPYIDHPEWVTAVWGPAAGINENNNVVFVNVFPNPSRDYLNINIKGNQSTNNRTIINLIQMDGKTIFEKIMDSNEDQINVSDVPNGIYFLVLKNQEFIKTEKITILK